MSTAQGFAPAELPRSSGFIGHPKGLFYLAFTEAWERFSYYGMTALLVLYMVNQLLLPGHVEHVVGFAGIPARAGGRIRATLQPAGLASQIFGLYAGFVYFTPVLGGWFADRWIGQRNAVVLGALSMSGGHIADGVRPKLPSGAVAAGGRLGLAQGQYLGAGRRALSGGR